ncbi:MAG TPA: sugar ABC transporter permease [Acidimicrobiia bacterium]|nr:sugar ABC transporter permease [Acidimicrobiia bacterium]
MATRAAEATTDAEPRRKRKLRGVKQGGMKAYLYLAPTLIVLLVFVYFPIIESFRLSLNRVAPFGSAEIFVGFEHYTRLLQSSEFWNNVLVSVFFMIGTVPIGIALAVGIALLLSYPVRRLAWAHRMLVFVPVVISSAIAGVLFRWLYNPVVGHINTWLGAIGIDGPDWLTSRSTALFAVTVAVVWRQLGFNVIIALAGLQQIDDVYYEAAKVDGASAWHRIRYITLPLLSPTLLFLVVINVIISFQAFGEIDILTQGGPGQATENLVYSVFVDGFVGTRFRGLASAQAFLLAIMVIAVSFIQFRGFRKRVHYG